MSRVVNALAPVGQLVRHDIALDQDLHLAVNELLLRADRLVPQAQFTPIAPLAQFEKDLLDQVVPFCVHVVERVADKDMNSFPMQGH